MKIVFAQEMTEQEVKNRESAANSPSVVITPYESNIEEAKKEVMKYDPNFPKGVAEIRVKTSPNAAGWVTNDPKDTGIIYVDYYQIKNKLGPEASKQDLIDELATTLIHEKAHIDNPEGGESVAENAEKQFKGKIENVSAAASIFYNLVKSCLSWLPS